MTMPVVPAGGLKTIGQIDPRTRWCFMLCRTAWRSRWRCVQPTRLARSVVDANGKYIGFINEFDVMKTRDEERDLSKLVAEHIMRKDRLVIPVRRKFPRGEDDGATWGRGLAG